MAKDSLDEWIYFLKNEEIKEDFRAKGIKQELDILKLSEEERQAYERYQHDLSLSGKYRGIFLYHRSQKGQKKRKRRGEN